MFSMFLFCAGKIGQNAPKTRYEIEIMDVCDFPIPLINIKNEIRIDFRSESRNIIMTKMHFEMDHAPSPPGSSRRRAGDIPIR